MFTEPALVTDTAPLPPSLIPVIVRARALLSVISPTVELAALKLPTAFAPPSVVPLAVVVLSNPAVEIAPAPLSLSAPDGTLICTDAAASGRTSERSPEACVIARFPVVLKAPPVWLNELVAVKSPAPAELPPPLAYFET